MTRDHNPRGRMLQLDHTPLLNQVGEYCGGITTHAGTWRSGTLLQRRRMLWWDHNTRGKVLQRDHTPRRRTVSWGTPYSFYSSVQFHNLPNSASTSRASIESKQICRFYSVSPLVPWCSENNKFLNNIVNVLVFETSKKNRHISYEKPKANCLIFSQQVHCLGWLARVTWYDPDLWKLSLAKSYIFPTRSTERKTDKSTQLCPLTHDLSRVFSRKEDLSNYFLIKPVLPAFKIWVQSFCSISSIFEISAWLRIEHLKLSDHLNLFNVIVVLGVPDNCDFLNILFY